MGGGSAELLFLTHLAETNIERRRLIRSEVDLQRFEIDDDEKAASRGERHYFVGAS